MSGKAGLQRRQMDVKVRLLERHRHFDERLAAAEL